jgi:hypothetical protein
LGPHIGKLRFLGLQENAGEASQDEYGAVRNRPG